MDYSLTFNKFSINIFSNLIWNDMKQSINSIVLKNDWKDPSSDSCDTCKRVTIRQFDDEVELTLPTYFIEKKYEDFENEEDFFQHNRDQDVGNKFLLFLRQYIPVTEEWILENLHLYFHNTEEPFIELISDKDYQEEQYSYPVKDFETLMKIFNEVAQWLHYVEKHSAAPQSL